jgi:hypothetical protein
MKTLHPSGHLLPRPRAASPLPIPVHIATRKPSRHTWRRATLILVCLFLFFLGHAFVASYYHSSLELQIPERDSFAPLHHNHPSGIRQILVLGSHHTGTSIVAKFIMDMGVFADAPKLKMLAGNALKYNEHQDALDADMEIMNLGTPKHDPPLHPSVDRFGSTLASQWTTPWPPSAKPLRTASRAL